jgi:hypothetical protein
MLAALKYFIVSSEMNKWSFDNLYYKLPFFSEIDNYFADSELKAQDWIINTLCGKVTTDTDTNLKVHDTSLKMKFPVNIYIWIFEQLLQRIKEESYQDTDILCYFILVWLCIICISYHEKITLMKRKCRRKLRMTVLKNQNFRD